jgi:hypothetical protein
LARHHFPASRSYLLTCRGHRCSYVDEKTPPIWGFIGPTVLVDRWVCHGHDGGIVLVESHGSRAPIQESPPLVVPMGVLLVCVELCIVYVAPASPISIPELKRWSLGGRSSTSTTSIIHRSIACPVTPPHLPMPTLSVATAGDLTLVPSSSS